MNKRKNANVNQTMVKLGKIGITPAGNYDAGKTYDKLCLVLGADGNSYLSTQESVTGIEPGVTEGWENYWQFLCGSGKGGGVQSDYAQNDETQMDYIKNRPGGYYKTLPAFDIQWDGQPTGKSGTISGLAVALFKVSDDVLTEEQMNAAALTMVALDVSETAKCSDVGVVAGDGFVAAGYYVISTSVLEGTLSSSSNGKAVIAAKNFSVPEPGTYFYWEVDSGYISRLEAKETKVLVPIPGELTNIKGGYDLPGKTEELYNGTIAADSWIEKGTSSQNLESDVAVQSSAAPSTYYEAPITFAAELTDGATITGTVAGTKVSGTVSGERAELYTVGNPKIAKVSSGRSLVCVITQNSIQASSAPETDIEVQLTQTVEGGPVVIPAEYLDTAALVEYIQQVQNTANSAQTAADQAKTAAATAQTTAEQANVVANSAQTTANNAQTAATSEIRTNNLCFRSPGSTDNKTTDIPRNLGVMIGNMFQSSTSSQYYPVLLTANHGLRLSADTSNPSEEHVCLYTEKVSGKIYGVLNLKSSSGESVTIRPGSIVGGNLTFGNGIIIQSSTTGSTKKFKIVVDDSGALSATEVTS